MTKLDTFSTAVAENMKSFAEESSKRTINEAETRTAKRTISELWQNALNTRKQTYWNHYRAKKTTDVFHDLLQQDPPKIPRKFLPRRIEGEPEDELEIRKQLSIEKFRTEINLLQLRAKSMKKNPKIFMTIRQKRLKACLKMKLLLH